MENKSRPPPKFMTLRIDDYLYTYKDNTTSLKYKIKFQFPCRNRCGVYLHVPLNFRFEKCFGKDALSTPIIKRINSFKKNDRSIFEEMTEDTIFLYDEPPHKSSCRVVSSEVVNPKIVGSQESNLELLREVIRKEPLKSSCYFRDLMVKMDQKFSFNKIKY